MCHHFSKVYFAYSLNNLTICTHVGSPGTCEEWSSEAIGSESSGHRRVSSLVSSEALSYEGDAHSNNDTLVGLLDNATTDLLQNVWSMWFDTTPDVDGFLCYASKVSCFDTLEGFWRAWDTILRQKLQPPCNLRVFRDGILPTVNDPHNRSGGRWVTTFDNHENRDTQWCRLALAMIQGNCCERGMLQAINGMSISTDTDGDQLQIWFDGGYAFRTSMFPFCLPSRSIYGGI